MKNRTKLPNIYMGLVLVITYLPILFVMIYSFNDSKLTASWDGFTLKWYESLFQNHALMEALGNSLILGVMSCLAAAIIGTLGAFGIARSHFRGIGVVEYISLMPIMVPEIILGMVFMAFFYMLNLPFGMVTLVIAHTAFCIPYIMMMVKGRLVGLDKSLEEAARDLGATPTKAFFDVTLPLIMPAVLSGSLLAFAMSMDDVVISIFVNGPTLSTLPIKVYTQMKTGVTPEINALCTLMLCVTLIVLAIYSLIKRRIKL